MRGLVQVCKNAQLLTVKKLGNADYGLADSNKLKTNQTLIGKWVKKESSQSLGNFCGAYGTRTRDLLRDRQAF